MCCFRWQCCRPNYPGRQMRWCNYFTTQYIRFIILPNGYTGYVPSPSVPTAQSIATFNAAAQTALQGQNFALGTLVGRQGVGLYYDEAGARVVAAQSGWYRVNYSFDVTSTQSGSFSTRITGMPATTVNHTVTAGVPYRASGGATVFLSQSGSVGVTLATAPNGGVTASNLTFSVIKSQAV